MPLNDPNAKSSYKELLLKLAADPGFRAEFFQNRNQALKAAHLGALADPKHAAILDKITPAEINGFVNRGPGKVAIEVSPGFSIK